MKDADRVPAILADIARFAVSAARVAGRGREQFFSQDDDDQRRIARSIIIDLSTAADRLPEDFLAGYCGSISRHPSSAGAGGLIDSPSPCAVDGVTSD